MLFGQNGIDLIENSTLLGVLMDRSNIDDLMINTDIRITERGFQSRYALRDRSVFIDILS